jgi:4-deoxy-L-threo-5-hexosulose-uronate ketol-isomerase
MSEIEMRVHRTADEVRYASLGERELRAAFVIEPLFAAGRLGLTLTDADRGIVGSAVPTDAALALTGLELLRADHFCQRRELGVLNIGGAGRVIVDGTEYDLADRDALYIGRGSREVSFASTHPSMPAQFYLLSYPAHAAHATTRVRHRDANVVRLGSAAEANERTIYQYIHEEGARSCQLVMGFTELAPGSVWNTMPPHTHARRTEIYMYFNVPEGHRVFHLLGRPEETRHLCLSDRCAVVSPGWSIHSGVGTAPYAFVWGMGGENQTFADMDGVGIDTLR